MLRATPSSHRRPKNSSRGSFFFLCSPRAPFFIFSSFGARDVCHLFIWIRNAFSLFLYVNLSIQKTLGSETKAYALLMRNLKVSNVFYLKR